MTNFSCQIWGKKISKIFPKIIQNFLTCEKTGVLVKQKESLLFFHSLVVRRFPVLVFGNSFVWRRNFAKLFFLLLLSPFLLLLLELAVLSLLYLLWFLLVFVFVCVRRVIFEVGFVFSFFFSVTTELVFLIAFVFFGGDVDINFSLFGFDSKTKGFISGFLDCCLLKNL